MVIFFTIIGLIFLIAGGVGLFYTHVNLIASNPVWVQGNITYATFTIVGLAIIIFFIFFGSEVE